MKEVLGLLASGFIKAGKGSSAVEMVRGASAINREIRVGITHVSDIHQTTDIARTQAIVRKHRIGAD